MIKPSKQATFFLLILVSLAHASERRAKNVILFIGDAGGIPVLNAASIHGHNAPAKLFIQNMPHQGLMDTSAARQWVTDSAAAMSAIVTGYKTDNGVISQLPASEDGKDGESVKTILEYAEEHGLATGVITNMSAADATPAACYAHARDRGMTGKIVAQVLTPRAGDGVDVLIGDGRKEIFAATAELGLDLQPELEKRGYTVYDSADAVSGAERRVVALMDSSKFDLGKTVQSAIAILSRNRKGFFLMVERDAHTTNPKRGLDGVLELDSIIRQTAQNAPKNTLVIFSADHSFDFRMHSGRKGVPLFPPAGAPDAAPVKPAYRVDNSHTGEEVLVAAQGPGAARVHGYFANTDLFHIMTTAFGWEKPQPGR